MSKSASLSAVSVENLGKKFSIWSSPGARLLNGVFGGRSTETWALRDVNFEVEPGASYGIIGRNGSGKSTLLKIVCGLMEPTIGRTVTRGRVLGLLELGAGLNPDLSGRENVHVTAALLGFPAEYARDRIGDIEAFADIGAFFDLPMKVYSSGMFVRLAFSLYVFLEPDILIIDEALSVGDAAFQGKCLQAMNRMREKGATMLFVSHSLAAVKAVCDRGLALQDGVVIAEGKIDAVVDAYMARHRTTETAAPLFTPTGRVPLSATELVAELATHPSPNELPPTFWRAAGARFTDSNGAPATLFEMRAEARIEVVLIGPDAGSPPAFRLDILDRFNRVVSGRTLDPSQGASIGFCGACAVAVVVHLPMEFAEGAYVGRVTLVGKDRPEAMTMTEIVNVFFRGIHPPYYNVANLPSRFAMERI